MHFISMYLGWIWSSSVPQTPIAASVLDEPQVSKTVAAYISENEENCIGKRFSDVSEKSSFWKLLYPLLDRKCIFQESTPIFGAKQSLTFREALINTMRYFDIAPTNGTSHFLDIPLGDSMQGYALVASRKGIITGSHAQPEHIMTREELADLIVKVWEAPRNPSQLRIYPDVDSMNPYYTQIQDYAFLTKDRGGKFYPKNIVINKDGEIVYWRTEIYIVQDIRYIVLFSLFTRYGITKNNFSYRSRNPLTSRDNRYRNDRQ